MSPLVFYLSDGLFAAVAAVGFAAISRPTLRIAAVAGSLAALGHVSRTLLLHATSMGISSASLCAAAIIGLASIPCANRWHTPAEMFVFPALLPMVPGMFAGYLHNIFSQYNLFGAGGPQGYVNFFWFVMLCCLATFAACKAISGQKLQ